MTHNNERLVINISYENYEELRALVNILCKKVKKKQLHLAAAMNISASALCNKLHGVKPLTIQDVKSIIVTFEDWHCISLQEIFRLLTVAGLPLTIFSSTEWKALSTYHTEFSRLSA